MQNVIKRRNLNLKRNKKGSKRGGCKRQTKKEEPTIKKKKNKIKNKHIKNVNDKQEERKRT